MTAAAQLETHALLGDTRTAAILAPDGSIAWLCLPRFDSPPVFGGLVGGVDGGHFEIAPAEAATFSRRGYRSESAVVETRWQLHGAQLRVTDGMVADVTGHLLPTTLLVRRIEAQGADVRVRIRFDPRRGYSRRPMPTGRRPDVVVCDASGLALALTTDPPTAIVPGQPCEVVVTPSRPLTLAMSAAYREPLVYVQAAHAWELLLADEHRWRTWANGIRDGGPFGELVVRSLITLRLLTFAPSGAPVAAPTTSLPEAIGAGRNWDYRYAWPRDASLGVDAFVNAGQVDEAKAFLSWLWHGGRLERPRLPVLLDIFGRHAPRERTLPGWPGYADSPPVRIGNLAATQHQLDGYGWVLEAGATLEDAGQRLYAETWRLLADLADNVATTWRGPDSGIWEMRGPPRHFVHSKLMAWLTLDRALRLASTHRSTTRRVERWRRERDALADEVLRRGVDTERGAFVQAYGERSADAALLTVPWIGIVPASDPRVAATIALVQEQLSAGGPLLFRYPRGVDGLDGDEGAFVPCSFWLAEAQARTGRLDDACATFEAMERLAGPFGLFGEEIDPGTGRHLGNYPQGLSHGSLVRAAYAITERMLSPV